MQANGSVTHLRAIFGATHDAFVYDEPKVKTLSAHRGVIYQTKGKGPLYTSVQLDGAL